MNITVGQTTISLVQGNITQQEDVAAIVNAANTSLLGGGGVDGAIHRAGGPSILEECRAIRAKQGSCPTGQAVITGAGNLPVDNVIHTVGPVWVGGHKGELVFLERAYENSLKLALKHALKTVAFPSISTGAYRFPVEKAALIALGTIARVARSHPEGFEEVRMVLFSEADFKSYASALDDLEKTMMG